MLTDQDARIMATIGRNTVKVGYNVQSAVDTENHFIVDHEVTNIGIDRAQLSKMALKAWETLGCEKMDVLADKGYFKESEILASESARITAYLPKTDTSGNQSKTASVTKVATIHMLLPLCQVLSGV